MENEMPSAQADQSAPTQGQGGGIQARIDELTAKFRQAEEQNAKLRDELLKQANEKADIAAQFAQQAAARQAAAQAPQQVFDPLAGFREQLDPVAIKALEAVTQNLQQRFEAQIQQTKRASAVEQAAFAVRAEAASVKGLPSEVVQRAEQLMLAWRQQGFDIPSPTDAIDIALGQYQRGQLARAAPVMGYQQNHSIPTVTPGYAPPPAAPKAALPANFDSLPRGQQIALLEQAGIGDTPF